MPHQANAGVNPFHRLRGLGKEDRVAFALLAIDPAPAYEAPSIGVPLPDLRRNLAEENARVFNEVSTKPDARVIVVMRLHENALEAPQEKVDRALRAVRSYNRYHCNCVAL